MQTANSSTTVGCGETNTQNSQTLQLWINIAFSWQGVIDHRPTWDFKMKTAGVFSGGGCRVTELMKPTGRQRHRNQRLHSPTHLTWLERLNWRAGDCGCSSSCRCWCLRSLLHWSPAVLKWFSVEFFSSFVSVAEGHIPRPVWKQGPFQQLCGWQNFRLDAYSWWAHVKFNDCLPRILMPYKLEGFYHPAHGKSYSWTTSDFLSLFHICCWTVKIQHFLSRTHILNVSLVLQQ